ncbi:MAG: hypothetical protein QM236_05310, partial [Bacillota bacterium]|nr:hypothetical protein [Bacillota bacterium]
RLAFLRVSALPELNYTALANEASVYAIAQSHAILSSAARTTAMLCNVSKHQRNGALFAELHSITQQQSSPTNNMRLCNEVNISVMKHRDV